MTTTFTTTVVVDLGQLSTELGTDALTMSSADGTNEISCHDPAITQAQLEDAVSTHVPAPPTLTPVQVLQAQVDELADLILTMEGGA